MKVFVAGGTGVIGWRAVQRLVAAGHAVTAVARSAGEGRARRARSAPNPSGVAVRPRGARPPPSPGTTSSSTWPRTSRACGRRRSPGAWAENDRIRTEGRRQPRRRRARRPARAATCRSRSPSRTPTRRRLDRRGHADRHRQGAEHRSPPPRRRPARFTAGGGTGVVLRFGLFYAPDSCPHRGAGRRRPAGHRRRRRRSRRVPVDDPCRRRGGRRRRRAGRARRHLQRRRVRAARRSGEVAEALGAAVGRRPRVLVPGKAAKLAGKATAPLTRSQRVSNRRFVEATGWEPAFPSVRAGHAEVVAAMPAPPRPPLLARLVRPAAVAPRRHGGEPRVLGHRRPGRVLRVVPLRPGLGRRRRAVQRAPHPRLRLAAPGLAVLYGAVALWPERRWVRVAALAALVDGVPHLAYHALNLDPYETADAVATIASLAFGLVLPAVMILGTATAPESRGDSSRRRAGHPCCGSIADFVAVRGGGRPLAYGPPLVDAARGPRRRASVGAGGGLVRRARRRPRRHAPLRPRLARPTTPRTSPSPRSRRRPAGAPASCSQSSGPSPAACSPGRSSPRRSRQRRRGVVAPPGRARVHLPRRHDRRPPVPAAPERLHLPGGRRRPRRHPRPVRTARRPVEPGGRRRRRLRRLPLRRPSAVPRWCGAPRAWAWAT